jgi:diamine N-acetyltransferase
MDEKITIRSASLDDAQLLAELSARTFHDTFASFNTEEDINSYIGENFNAGQITVELQERGTTFLLAQQDGSAIGYAKLKKREQSEGLSEENTIEIERIYSSKEYLGKGVGQRLMEACLTLATQRGYKVIWLGVWEYNPRAISFYKKWGFEEFGSHPFVLGKDVQTDLLMKKNLY